MTLFDRNGNEFVANWKVGAHQRPAHRRSRSCTRCGGAGGADAWKHTGWKCYRCGGNGVDPNPEIIKLYTAEENVKLDERAEQASKRQKAKAEEKARVEQERRDAERDKLLSIYATYIKRLEVELSFGEVEIIRSVLERITVKALDPTERQVEVVEEIISRNEKERQRLENVGHIGEIGKRQDFDLTLVYASFEHTGDWMVPIKYWIVMRDEMGRTVVSSSKPRSLGLSSNGEGEYKPGQQIRVKATVVKHYINKKGEPCTKINRPVKIAGETAA